MRMNATGCRKPANSQLANIETLFSALRCPAIIKKNKNPVYIPGKCIKSKSATHNYKYNEMKALIDSLLFLITFKHNNMTVYFCNVLLIFFI